MNLRIPLIKGCLIQVYTKPWTYPNIETLDAFDKSGIWVGIQYNNNLVDLFEDRGGSPLSTQILINLIAVHHSQYLINIIGNMKHKLVYNIDETVFGHMAHVGGIAALERGLNEPSQTKKFTRSNGQSLLNFVNECPR